MKSLEVYENQILGELAEESLKSGVHTVEDTERFLKYMNKKYNVE